MSGGMLLARQTFRRLFRSERVDEREGLGIRQVTFLFTDLKGSTAMYERLGDLNAYALVREHFALLDAAVQEHSGAIVKTIGDAVMAVFSRPADAISAALHILEEIDRFNGDHGEAGDHPQDRRPLRTVDRRDAEREPRLFRPDRERRRARAVAGRGRRDLHLGGAPFGARRERAARRPSRGSF